MFWLKCEQREAHWFAGCLAAHALRCVSAATESVQRAGKMCVRIVCVSVSLSVCVCQQCRPSKMSAPFWSLATLQHNGSPWTAAILAACCACVCMSLGCFVALLQVAWFVYKYAGMHRNVFTCGISKKLLHDCDCHCPSCGIGALAICLTAGHTSVCA